MNKSLINNYLIIKNVKLRDGRFKDELLRQVPYDIRLYAVNIERQWRGKNSYSGSSSDDYTSGLKVE